MVLDDAARPLSDQPRMLRHQQLSDAELRRLIKSGEVRLAGNARLKIYGTLACTSGRRMKRENRVFFVSEQEAIASGYRPCGHCMRLAYRAWIQSRAPDDI